MVKRNKKKKQPPVKVKVVEKIVPTKMPLQNSIQLPKEEGGVKGLIKKGLNWLVDKGVNFASKIFGMGAYHIRANSLADPFHKASSGGPPVFSTAPRVRIRHREFLEDVTSSVSFSSTKWKLNPGDPSTFPWLSGIAPHFTQYKIHGLVFEYCSRSATAVASTNTALGSVILTTQYDPRAPDFANKTEMEAYEYTCATDPSKDVIHFVECAPARNVFEMMYIRSGDLPTGADVMFYDKGFLQLATVGMQAASTIGELWVSYDIELFKPALPSGGVLAKSASISSSWTAGASDTSLQGSNRGTLSYDFNPLGISYTGTTVTVPRPGFYMVGQMVGVSTALASTPIQSAWSMPTGSSFVNFYTTAEGNASSSRSGIAINNKEGWSFFCMKQTTQNVTYTLTMSDLTGGVNARGIVTIYEIAEPKVVSVNNDIRLSRIEKYLSLWEEEESKDDKLITTEMKGKDHPERRKPTSPSSGWFG